MESDWITTIPDRGWITLCLYVPTKGYFDKTWLSPVGRAGAFDAPDDRHFPDGLAAAPSGRG